MTTAVPAAFDSFNEGATGAVVFTVPHAGRDYPTALIERLAVPALEVMPLEDRLADLLVAKVTGSGWRTLVARSPRLEIDLNRAETDFEARSVAGARGPAARPSHRARGGLGLVPDRLGRARLWRTPLPAAELAERIATRHRPWHRAVESALRAARAANGSAILLDVHSMPPLPGHAPAQVVIGDRHGASATREISQLVAEFFTAAGLRVACNTPFAGAHMLERHGNPQQSISALQIEFDRRLYLDAALLEPGAGLTAMQQLLTRLAARLDARCNITFPLAAE